MQISQITAKNPNQYLGLWVTQASYPEAGAGQIQFFAPGRCAYFIEHWQKSVVNNLSLNGLLYKPYQLELAKFLYLGNFQNTLYYAHGSKLRKMPWLPTGDAPVLEALEAMDFRDQKHYLIKREQLEHNQEITDEDKERILHRWQQTGELESLIPYLVPYQALGNARTSLTKYLTKLKAYLPIQVKAQSSSPSSLNHQ